MFQSLSLSLSLAHTSLWFDKETSVNPMSYMQTFVWLIVHFSGERSSLAFTGFSKNVPDLHKFKDHN